MLVGEDDSSEERPGTDQTSPEERADARRQLGVLERAIDPLPELYRAVFVLRELEQMSTAETAEALGTPEDVVKTRLSRAWSMLRAARSQLAGLFEYHASRCDRLVGAVLSVLSGQCAPSVSQITAQSSATTSARTTSDVASGDVGDSEVLS